MLTACGQNTAPTDTTEKESEISTDSMSSDLTTDTQSSDSSLDETDQPTESKKDVLLVVFSATGTTKAVAERIAEYTDGDL